MAKKKSNKNTKIILGIAVGVLVVAAGVAIFRPGSSQADVTASAYVVAKCAPTMLVGHRGSGEPGVRNNTLPALQKGVAGGADGVEIDIRVTKSTKNNPAVWVVNHDASVTRVVKGVTVSKKISSTTYKDLKKFAPDLMTLSTAVAYTKSVGKNIEIEIKPSSVSAGRLQALSDYIRKYGVPSKTTFTSFHSSVLKSYRALKNEVGRTGLITNTALPISTTDLNSYAASVRKYANTIVMRYSSANPTNIATLQRYGLFVEVYTTSTNPAIDTSTNWDKYVSYRANAIITDQPKAFTNWCSSIQPTLPAPV